MGSTLQQRVDYDRIAHLYDEPLRDHEADPALLRFLAGHPGLLPGDLRILDMGCGTGKQLAANRQILASWLMVGLDLFAGMLDQARQRNAAITWMQGDGAHLPFHDESFDYVTSQFSYHHVLDYQSMFAETFRTLKQGGRFVMTNLDPFSMPGWIVYNYFPAARDRDYVDFLPVDQFARMLNSLGFSDIQVHRQAHRQQTILSEFLTYAIQRYRTSQLMVIDDDQYAAGLATLRAHIDQRGRGACVDSEICLVTVAGDKHP